MSFVRSQRPVSAAGCDDAAGPARDAFSRPLQDLRISVTDRCNFRCVYCMPSTAFPGAHHFLGRDELLRFDEIVRLVRAFADLGVGKVRLTGGEPLIRPHLEDLVAMIAEVPGIEDVALTTNGSLLSRGRAEQLRQAGLSRVSISLDSLRDDVFKTINGAGVSVAKVLSAIDAAAETGLPVKINTVVRRGLNEDDVPLLAEYFRGSGHVLRFIEYMDVGNLNGWREDDVVPAKEILGRIAERWPLEPAEPTRFGEVARRYRYLDGRGEIGVIASITEPFCTSCTRARLSADGQLFTCLFASGGRDLRTALREGTDDGSLRSLLESLWAARSDRYSALRAAQPSAGASQKVEMYHIGG